LVHGDEIHGNSSRWIERIVVQPASIAFYKSKKRAPAVTETKRGAPCDVNIDVIVKAAPSAPWIKMGAATRGRRRNC
jgi:hypothetical protein